MATTYDPSLASATDRVRLMIDDRAATWRFQDEEIQATIDGYGTGDAAEIQAAIQLLESSPTGDSSTTQKQGSWSRTTKTIATSSRIAWLQSRLDKIYLTEAGISFTGVGAADAEMPYPVALPSSIDGVTFYDESYRPLSPTE